MMKLRRARIENFRSIVDSGAVDIEDRVTVIIGKNEQGKTTFLKGLASSNPKIAYGPADLPNHLRPNLESQNARELRILTLWISPDLSDRARLQSIIPDVEEIDAFKVTRFYDGYRQYHRIRGDTETILEFAQPNIDEPIALLRLYADNLKSRLAAHANREANFQPHLPQALSLLDEFVSANFHQPEQIPNLIKALSTGLTSVPNQDAPIQEDIAAIVRDIQAANTKIRQLLSTDATSQFEKLLPHFALHSTTLDKIPNEVPISEFIKNPDVVSKGMSNLCGVAGLSMQKIQELANSSDTSMREGYEDHYRAGVSGGLNEFWTQQTYTVHFRFDQEKMSVSISDGTYGRRIAPSDRSDGFQWYLSFYTALINEVSDIRPTVFLLDNPGLELHPDGQRDIKRFLEEKLPSNAQIIYVTHSPAMIDPYNLEQVRQVELKSDMRGTKVSKVAPKNGSDFDLYEPVRSAIGASLATSLIFDQFNVLVEGAADKPILEAALHTLHKDKARTVLVNGSIAESKDCFLVKFYQRAKLPFVAYVDADASGRAIKDSLTRAGVDNEKIADLAEIMQGVLQPDFELEDVISAAVYNAAVNAAYPELEVGLPEVQNGKRTRQYEALFRERHHIGFNKKRVAEKVKALLLADQIDRETEDNLRRVTTAIWASLEAQVGQ